MNGMDQETTGAIYLKSDIELDVLNSLFLVNFMKIHIF